ncbi:MAG TPA: ABC transporter permease [Thermoanaerobaculia bacterium]|jgi:predicted permease|nr:ABC transporter permease [Thermoanaerobaculia bacterium]
MERLLQDLRYALRTLLRSPGFSAVVILTLALGIGANTAIFSVINALLLRQLPVEKPDELAKIFMRIKGLEGYTNFNYPDYRDFRERSRVFSGLAGQAMVRVGVSQGAAESELVWGEIVTGNYFDVLGVKAERGRTFLPEEDVTPNGHPVVVLSHSFWERSFGSDPNILGKSIKLNGYPFTVVGIAPKSFQGTKYALAMDLWIPMMMRAQVKPGGNDWIADRGDSWFDVIGRLKPGVSLEQARAEIGTISRQLQLAYPKENQDKSFQVFWERDARVHPEAGSRLRVTAVFVLVLVALVLLVACVNVINLLLARAATRQSEIGVRIAIGAGRSRLVRQLFTESLMLSLLGGALGVALAYWGSGLLSGILPPLPYRIGLDFHPDGRALVYTLLIAVVTSVVLGLAPAIHAARTQVVSVLKGEEAFFGQPQHRLRLRKVLVVAQTAVSLMLLVATGLFATSLIRSQSADPGFRVDHGLLLSVDVDMRNYSQDAGEAFYRQLQERIGALPGVVSTSFAYLVPLGDRNNSLWVYREGADRSNYKEAILADQNTVGTRYFDTLGIQLLEGRPFDDHDVAEGPKVAIVNETLARLLWPGEDPIGKRIIFSGRNEPLREVIGLVKNGKSRQLNEEPLPYLYLPFTQDYYAARTLHVRTNVRPEELIPSVREAVRSLDPNLPVYDIKTLKDHMAITLWPARIGAAMTAVSGVLALFLALVGIYGVIAYSVSQRTREIGLRIAFGARRADLVRLVVKQGMMLALTGIGIGLLLALGLSLIVSKLHFGVRPADPVVFGATCLLFVTTSLFASYLPARRASRMDPMVALRT